MLAAKTDPVNLPLYWTVFAEGQPDAILFAARAANPYVPVLPGRYVVGAREGPCRPARLWMLATRSRRQPISS